MPTPSSPTPQIKTIGMMQPLVWLVLDWRDHDLVDATDLPAREAL